MVSKWHGSQKLVWNNDEFTIFDLDSDPGELDPMPLSTDHPLFEEFSRFVDQAVASDRAKMDRPDPEMMDALRRLGYIID